jgi:hypothetical protein
MVPIAARIEECNEQQTGAPEGRKEGRKVGRKEGTTEGSKEGRKLTEES